MIDLIKKTLLAGLGATIVTKEKIEAALQDLVAQGKVTAKEASGVASKLADEGRKEFEAAKEDLGHRIHELLKRANFAPKSQVEALEARLRVVEEKLGIAPPTPPAPPAAGPEPEPVAAGDGPASAEPPPTTSVA